MTPRIRPGGYVLITWVTDHSPRHVHVFEDDELIVRWNLEEWKPLRGESMPGRRIVELIAELVEEGRLS